LRDALRESTLFLAETHEGELSKQHASEPCSYCDRIEANEDLLASALAAAGAE
jgi:hypothetical protein